MYKAKVGFLIAAALTVAVPAVAQRALPGTADVSRITAGHYVADPNHTQIAWSVSHLGFNIFNGIFGNATGTLTLDPAKPGASAVSIDIPLAKVVTTRDALTAHLQTPDFFDAAKYPVATFRSTNVTVSGTNAKIAGNLTIRGITKPIVLDAHFVGAGVNPRSKKQTVGFEATGRVTRTDFGIMYGLGEVGEQVDLRITVGFEKVA